MEFEEVKSRLREGEILEVNTGGGVFEVWVEPYANPPSVYYQGEQLPISELDRVVNEIIQGVNRKEIRCRWVED